MQIINNYKNNNIYNESIVFSKFLIFNFIALILLIPLIILIIFTSDSFNKYGLAIAQPFLLPLNINAMRAWFLFVLVLYAFIVSLMIINAIKYHKFNQAYQLKSIFSCILPILFFNNLLYGLRNNYVSNYWNYISSNTNNEQISHYEFYQWITKKQGSNKLVRNTLLFYITLIIFTVSLGFIFSDYYDYQQSNNYFIFYGLSFFTQQNNFLCWVFLMLFFFFNKKNLFNNNTYLLYIASYILVVGVIAVLMIGPYASLDHQVNKFYCAYPYVKFIWFHVIDPIMFVWFAINTMSQNYIKPKAYKSYIINFLHYPIFYGIYAYSLPFICNASVYGGLTNLNPNMVEELSTSGGNPWWVFGIFAMVLVFIGFGSLLRAINNKIINNFNIFQVTK